MSEAKVTRRAVTGNVSGLLDALRDLERTAPAYLDETPRPLRVVIEALLEEFAEIPSSAPTAGSDGEALSIGAALQAGLTPKRMQHGRHDGKRVPPGYEFRAGGLYRDTARISETERDRDIARGIRDDLDESLYWAPGTLGPRREALEAAFELVKGHPFGEEWRSALETELEWDAEAKAAVGLRAAHPLQATGSTFIEPVTDEQFLVRMRMRVPEGTRFPPELDVAAVADLRERVALNKGGSKKTPRALVQEFADSLRK